MRARSDVTLYLTLLVGVVAVSFAAVFIRLAEAPSLVIAAYRLTLASLLVAPVGLVGRWREMKGLDRKDLAYAVVSGLLLSLHFAFWIASLEYTTVASSVFFVSVNPLIVGMASLVLTRDRVSRVMFAGIGVAVLGGVIIAWDDFALGGSALRGDLLALLGAVAVSGYLIAGRRLRPKVSLLVYISIVYSIAALGTLAWCAITRQRMAGYSGLTFLMFILLAVGPQLIGHSSFNWALRHMSAPAVGVAILGEPVGSTLLAYLILQEAPTLAKLAGGALILGGIYFSLREERAQKSRLLRNGVEPAL